MSTAKKPLPAVSKRELARAEALRENLRKRKEQLQTRTTIPAKTNKD